MPVEPAPRVRTMVPDGAANRRRHARSAERRLADLLADFSDPDELPQWSAGEAGEHLAALENHLVDLTDAILARVRSRAAELSPAEHVRLCEVIVALQQLRQEHADRVLNDRLRALDWAQDAFTGEGPVDVHRLLQRAAEEAGRICGLDRVLIYRVDESRLIPEVSWFSGDHNDWAAEMLEMARRNPVELRGQRYEIEMIRRRHAVLVTDPREDPRIWGPVLEKGDVSGFLSVPVVADGEVVATLAADTYFSRRPLDTLDRDCLAAFARGLGHALERADLVERMHAQREVVSRLLRAAERSVDELCSAEFSLGRRPSADGDPAPATRRSLAPARSDSLPEAELTTREAQIMQLMAAGATNADIARRLVITEGTVKSHVKHILRKLGAANRAQAVSIYHGARAVGAG